MYSSTATTASISSKKETKYLSRKKDLQKVSLRLISKSSDSFLNYNIKQNRFSNETVFCFKNRAFLLFPLKFLLFFPDQENQEAWKSNDNVLLILSAFQLFASLHHTTSFRL